MTSFFLIITFLGVLIEVKSQRVAERLCSEGYTNILQDLTTLDNTLCLKVFAEPLSWQAAQQTCHAEYSHLAILSERYLSTFGGISNVHERLLSTLLKTSEPLLASWVSLRVNKEGILAWQNVKPLDYFAEERPLYWRWGAGQPDKSQGSCALAMLTTDAQGVYVFNVTLADCQKELPFACVNPGYSGLAKKVSRCPDGWFGSNFADVCYKHETENRLAYHDARRQCAALQGSLASPTSPLHHALAASASPGYPNANLPVFTRRKRQTLSCVRDMACKNGGTCVIQGGSWQCVCDQGTFGQFCEIRIQGSQSCAIEPCKNHGICRDSTISPGFLCYCKYPQSYGVTCEEDVSPRGACRETPCGGRGDCYESYIGGYLCKCHHGFKGNRCETVMQTDIFWSSAAGGECVALNSTEPGKTMVLDCNILLPYVCERTASPPASCEVTEHPQDLRAKLADMAQRGSDWRDIYLRANVRPADDIDVVTNPVFLMCNAVNYHPDLDIIWIKDGKFFWSAPPASGFSLDIAAVASKLGLSYPGIQGYYHCEVWGQAPYTRVVSRKALVTFSDVLTFQGILQIPSYLYHTRYVGITNDEPLTGLLRLLITYNQPGSNTPAINQIRQGKGGGLQIDFSIYHLSKNLTDQVLPWNTTHVQSATFTEFYRKYLIFIYNSLLDGMARLMQDANSPMYKDLQAAQINSEGIELLSTSHCMPRETLHNKKTRLWGLTRIGSQGKTQAVCLADGVPLGISQCVGNFTSGGFWNRTNYHQSCQQTPQSDVTPTLKILAETKVTGENVETVSHQTNNLTRNSTILTYTDIVYTSHILANIGKVDGSSTQVGEEIVETVSSILDVQPSEIQRAQVVDDASNRIVRSLSEYSQRADLRGMKIRRFIKPNVALEIIEPVVESDLEETLGFGVISSQSADDNNYTALTNDSVVHFDSLEKTELENIDAAIFLPQDAINMAKRIKGLSSTTMDGIRVVYTVYQMKKLFLSPSELSNSSQFKIVNSKIISGSVGDVQVRDLNQFVWTVFRPLRNVSTEEACVYWDFEAVNGTGNWSTKGCVRDGLRAGRIVCRCNHMTNFAVLTDFNRSEIDPVHHLALTIITYIGLGLSIVGLSLTILSFILFKKLREGKSQKTLFNLAIALISVDIIFLAGIDKTSNFVGCVIVAALLQYFLMVSFMWMLVEGILQYMRYVKVFPSYIHKFTLKAGIPAWLVPAAVVGIVAIVDYNLFRGPENYCWLALSAFYYAFLVPVIIIIIINVVVFILIVRSFCKRPKILTSTQKDSELILLQARASLVCLICMGLTWIFGFLAINDLRLVFQYLFCIFNSFQGFFIFIMLNIRERAVREAWAGLCPCRKPKTRLHSSAGITFTSGSTDSTDTDTLEKKPKKAFRVTHNGESHNQAYDNNSGYTEGDTYYEHL